MIKITDLKKTYHVKKGEDVYALNGVNILLPNKGMVFVLGKSGSGKSTFLNILGGLDNFDQGDIEFNGCSIKNFNEEALNSYRNTFVGFIFQEYNLLDEFSVGANVAFALELQGKKVSVSEIEDILDIVGLTGFQNRKINELSGGQKQRVAIARVLIKNPQLILADEPTGALDSETGKQILASLKEISKSKLVVVVTHDQEFATNYGDRIISFKDGKVISDVERNDNIEEQKNKLYNEDIELHDNEIIVLRKTKINKKDLNKILDELEEINQYYRGFKKTNIDEKNITYEKPTFIKAKLPIKNAIKVSLNALKTKPLRLVFTILLSCIAFALFGLSDTFSNYNYQTALVNSIKDVGVDYISYKEYKVYGKSSGENLYSQHGFTQDSLNYVMNKTNTKLYGVYKNDLELDITSNIYNNEALEEYPFYYVETLSGMISTNEELITNNRLSYQGNLPTRKNEVAITSYTYEHFLNGGYINPITNEYIQSQDITPSVILNKPLKVDETIYTITAIINVNINFDRYNSLKTKEKDTLESARNEFKRIINSSLINLLFVSNELIEDIKMSQVDLLPGMKISENAELGASYHYRANGKSDDDNYTFTRVIKVSDAKNFTFINNNEDGIYLNWYQVLTYANKMDILKNINLKAEDETATYKTLDDLYDNLEMLELKEISKKYIEENISVLTNALEIKGQLFVARITSIISTTLGTFNVCGVYYSDDDQFYFINDNVYNTYEALMGGFYDFAVGKMPTDLNDIKLVCSDISKDNVKYTINNEVVYSLESINNFVNTLVGIFKYVGIGIGIFACLLLFNFISVSISYKRHEIGVLRAIGAGKTDVFSIFFAESLWISLINFFISIIVLVVGIAILNDNFRTNYGILVTILNLGAKQILLLLVVAILLAFVSSFLPVLTIASQKPVDAIRDK